MSKRDVNVIDASLPAAPTPMEFVATLRSWREVAIAKKGQSVSVDPIHGTLFNNAPPTKKKGTQGTEMCGVLCALEFHAVCEETKAEYPSLDQWLMSFARFTVAPRHLFDSEAEIASAIAQRKVTCGKKFRYYELPVGSFRTYLNALCRVCTAAGLVLVSSSVRQLPELQILMANAITRSRKEKATRAAQANDAVLSESEFKVVMDVPATSLLEEQRKNILALAFATGMRADNLAKLQLNSFCEERMPTGQGAM